jgi:hypothetical protein
MFSKKERLATHILTHIFQHSFWLVKIHMGPTKFIWDPHDLVRLVWILTNHRECVNFNQSKRVCWKMCVRMCVASIHLPKNNYKKCGIRDENNIYLKFLKFAISMILMCLIWMHHMRKGKNLDNTLQFLVLRQLKVVTFHWKTPIIC